jgi:hypothetical protein
VLSEPAGMKLPRKNFHSCLFNDTIYADVSKCFFYTKAQDKGKFGNAYFLTPVPPKNRHFPFTVLAFTALGFVSFFRG